LEIFIVVAADKFLPLIMHFKIRTITKDFTKEGQ